MPRLREYPINSKVRTRTQFCHDANAQRMAIESGVVESASEDEDESRAPLCRTRRFRGCVLCVPAARPLGPALASKFVPYESFSCPWRGDARHSLSRMASPRGLLDPSMGLVPTGPAQALSKIVPYNFVEPLTRCSHPRGAGTRAILDREWRPHGDCSTPPWVSSLRDQRKRCPKLFPTILSNP